MAERTITCDVLVCGGGLAGFSAAVAAARLGRRTVLVQDRPVLGGNSSSEIRVTPHGAAAFHYYARETGIISEALIEERYRNHEEIFENGWTNSVWDLTLYDIAVRTENLELWVNTSCRDVRISENGRRILAVDAWVNNAELRLTIEPALVVDATGDGIIAAAAGCSFRYGSEGKDEFGEVHAPETGSPGDVMGNSLHFKTKDTGRDAPFVAPEWAEKLTDADYFYAQGRKPKDERGGFWWVEMAKPFHPIDDAEQIRHELTRYVLGIWDWMKNHDPVMKERTRTWALDWIGQVPGKRESRRVNGIYLMTENDIQEKRAFEDEIAFGGWFLDLHTPGGLLADHSEPTTRDNYSPYTERSVASYVGPYAIPLSSTIAKDVDNLFLAGRDMSLSHAAFGSVRVMETLAQVGQGVGTAAAIALEEGLLPAELPVRAAGRIKQRMLRDGCFLLHTRNEDPADLARSATVRASSTAPVHGVSPGSAAFHDGLSIWWDQYNPMITERLDATRGQLIAVGDERLESGPALYEGHLVVRPGGPSWCRLPVDLDVRDRTTGSFLRLDLYADDGVLWHVAAPVLSGQVAMFEITSGRMRTYQQGVTMSFRVSPAQYPYPASNVQSGWTRPYHTTNLWRSDPALPLDQWIELSWPNPVTVSQVELTFPGHLLREYHAYGPCYRDPQTPMRYSVEVSPRRGEWERVLEVHDNYQRHRKHLLERRRKNIALRVVVHRTNGDPSAGIYEIRCY